MTDSQTGLVWQQTVDGSYYSELDASAYCNALSLSAGGFRLPSKDELLSIVDPSGVHPAILDASGVFAGTPGNAFWTATANDAVAGAFWNVSFYDGHVGYDLGTSASSHARCVR